MELGRAAVAVQAQIAQMGVGVGNTQYSYDFQPVLQNGLSTIESGLATNEVVTVTVCAWLMLPMAIWLN